MSDRPKIELDNPVTPRALHQSSAIQSLHVPISPRSRNGVLNVIDPDQKHLTIQARPASGNAAEITIAKSRQRSMDGIITKKHPARLSRPIPAGSIKPSKANLIAHQFTVPIISTIRQPLHIIAPQPFARPAHVKLQRSKVLHRRAVKGHFTAALD